MSKESIISITGTVFRRTIRAAYARLDILLSDDNNHDDIRVIAVVQFHCVRDVRQFRSDLKRICKIGNEIQLEGSWDDDKKFNVLPDISDNEFYLGLTIIRQQKLNTMQCQKIREKFAGGLVEDDPIKQSCTKRPTRPIEKGYKIGDADNINHSGGLSKRMQGEILRDFLIQVMVKELLECNSQEINYTFSESFSIDKMDKVTLKNVISFLNTGSGVLDVAGGSGHVSLAFSLLGIKSTVIDPRETVGKLPGRDRKIFKKAIKNKKNALDKGEVHDELFLPPPIEYASLRAWFAKRPEGIDASFREGASSYHSFDDHAQDPFSKSVPLCTICSPNSDLLRNCSAIIALHPDEATGDIVDFAVEHRIPFLIVPCCVFSRLFPHRFIVDENDKGKVRFVSTYKDLIQFLARKDRSIRISKLGFSGANIALWSMFPKEEKGSCT